MKWPTSWHSSNINSIHQVGLLELDLSCFDHVWERDSLFSINQFLNEDFAATVARIESNSVNKITHKPARFTLQVFVQLSKKKSTKR